MDKIIIVKNQGGGCSIVHPAPAMFDKASATRALLQSRGLDFNSEQEILDYIIARNVPEGCEHRIATIDKLPSDRVFRDAWTDENPSETVDIDMQKARAIHMDRLRLKRNDKLKLLDVEYIKAMESDDNSAKNAIKALKQQLRDLPTAYDLGTASTPEELKLMIPEILA